MFYYSLACQSVRERMTMLTSNRDLQVFFSNRLPQSMFSHHENSQIDTVFPEPTDDYSFQRNYKRVSQ